MNPLYSFVESFVTLKDNKFRTFLIILGIFVGVASIIAIISTGMGVRIAVMSDIDELGSTMINVRPNYRAYETWDKRTRLQLEDVEVFKQKFPNSTVLPYMIAFGKVKACGRSCEDKTYGMGREYFDVFEKDLKQGRFLDDLDHDLRRKVAVIGSRMAQRLFKDECPIGRTIFMVNSSYTVVGVMGRAVNQNFRDGIDTMSIIVPIETLYGSLSTNWRERFGINHIMIKADDKKNVDKIIQQGEVYLFAKHGLINDKPRFIFRSFKANIEKSNQIFEIITLVISLIAGISLLVSGIGIMNVMLVAVSERTREIGIRKSLGAKPRDILSQFLIEAITICLLGGVVGVLLGFLFTFIIAGLMNNPFYISGASIIISLGVSLAIGFIFGFFPAIKASRLDPITALSKG